MRKFWAFLVVFVSGLSVGAAPSVVSVLGGPDRLGGFTELALVEPSVVSYGAPPASPVLVSIGNFDGGSRRYEWEFRLASGGSLLDSGSVLLGPGAVARFEVVQPSSGWVELYVLGIPQKLRWATATSPDSTLQPAPKTSSPPITNPSPQDGDTLPPSSASPASSTSAPVSDTPAGPASGEGSLPGTGVLEDTSSTNSTAPWFGYTPPSPTAAVDDPNGLPLLEGGLSVSPPPPIREVVRVDDLDPIRPRPVWVPMVELGAVFFAPHAAKIDSTGLAGLVPLIGPALSGRKVSVFCDGYTQYGSTHGADVRLSQRRADSVCAAIEALGLEADFFPIGHGRAGFSGDAARFVAVRIEYEIRPHPGAASLVPAHG